MSSFCMALFETLQSLSSILSINSYKSPTIVSYSQVKIIHSCQSSIISFISFETIVNNLFRKETIYVTLTLIIYKTLFAFTASHVNGLSFDNLRGQLYMIVMLCITSLTKTLICCCHSKPSIFFGFLCLSNEKRVTRIGNVQ